MLAKISDNEGHTEFVVNVPEIIPYKNVKEIFLVGEWSFDTRDESDPQLVLDAIGAWIAWYKHLTKENNE